MTLTWCLMTCRSVGVMTPTLRIQLIRSILILTVSLHNLYPFTFYFPLKHILLRRCDRATHLNVFSFKVSEWQQTASNFLKEQNWDRKPVFNSCIDVPFMCAGSSRGAQVKKTFRAFFYYFIFLNSCSFCEFSAWVGGSAAAGVAMATWTHSRRRSATSSSSLTRFIPAVGFSVGYLNT